MSADDPDDDYDNECETSSGWWVVWLVLILIAMIVLVSVGVVMCRQPVIKPAKRVRWSDGWTAVE